MLTGHGDKSAILWDMATGTELRRLSEHTTRWTRLPSTPADGEILTRSGGNAILWDTGTGAKLHTFAGSSSEVSSVALAGGDKPVMITAVADEPTTLWDAATWEKLHTLAGHSNKLSSIALSRNGQRVLTGSYDKTAILWDVAGKTYVSAVYRTHRWRDLRGFQS